VVVLCPSGRVERLVLVGRFEWWVAVKRPEWWVPLDGLSGACLLSGLGGGWYVVPRLSESESLGQRAC
jgi:hypothetical protein